MVNGWEESYPCCVVQAIAREVDCHCSQAVVDRFVQQAIVYKSEALALLSDLVVHTARVTYIGCRKNCIVVP